MNHASILRRSILALAALAVAGGGLQWVREADAQSTKYQVFYSPTSPDVYCSGECGTGVCCIL